MKLTARELQHIVVETIKNDGAWLDDGTMNSDLEHVQDMALTIAQVILAAEEMKGKT